jgi:hypothetical protein
VYAVIRCLSNTYLDEKYHPGYREMETEGPTHSSYEYQLLLVAPNVEVYQHDLLGLHKSPSSLLAFATCHLLKQMRTVNPSPRCISNQESVFWQQESCQALSKPQKESCSSEGAGRQGVVDP